MTFRIRINRKRCVLCRYCEVICSFALRGEFEPGASHIREIRDVGDLDEEFTCSPPPPCKDEPQCAQVCDQRAIKFSRMGS